MHPFHIFLLLLTCALHWSNGLDGHKDNPASWNNLTREAPRTYTNGQLVQCKQMECWKSKRFMLLQVDNMDEETRDEWRGLRWNMSNLSPAVISSWYTHMYAKRHGLEYTLHSVRGVPSNDGRRTRFFMKTFVVPRYLKEVDFLLVLDFDAMVSEFDQDIRCLLEMWGFNCERQRSVNKDKAEPIFLGSEDPAYNIWNYQVYDDGRKWLNINTGFMVVRSTERSRELWDAYTDIVKSNVSWWGPMWYHDQGFWNGYVRKLMRPGEQVALPCEEANGYRWVGNHGQWGCSGKWITHGWWYGKVVTAHEMFRRMMLVWTQPLEAAIQHDYTDRAAIFPFLDD
mmetsp:Transcript_29576/g.75393  ORF Transcript_29576/g.75393 Transcript_29576/m.75393 type:complete len:340 (-) Transcript_29576:1029-2048(-)